MDLCQIIKQAEITGEKLWDDIERCINKISFKQPMCPQWIREDKYVRYLGGLAKTLEIVTGCEIGTMYGNSALGFSFGCIGVDSYDVDISNIAYDPIPFNIRQILLKDYEDYLNIPFKQYELIFVDIGAHSGKEEIKLHDKLCEIGYQGIVCYDDVGPTWPGMLPFWRSIEKEKVLNNWHSSGFGIVKYV